MTAYSKNYMLLIRIYKYNRARQTNIIGTQTYVLNEN